MKASHICLECKKEEKSGIAFAFCKVSYYLSFHTADSLYKLLGPCIKTIAVLVLVVTGSANLRGMYNVQRSPARVSIVTYEANMTPHCVGQAMATPGSPAFAKLLFTTG